MPHEKTTRVDVTSKQIKGLSLGDEVTIITKGEIVELEAERSFTAIIREDKKGKKDVFPPSIMIKVSSTKVEGKNDFDDLAD